MPEPISATPPPIPSEGNVTAAAPRGPDPLLGKVLQDRVRIVRPIARGGMGRVYLGEQTRMKRRCAVKVLDPRFTSGADSVDFAKRFLLEASVTSKLAHPNVVTIFDYGESADGCFIAMEYLEGRSLSDELAKSGRIVAERAVHIALQVARALREAHAIGVVHRDVKPGNIFLLTQDDDPDFVKVLDFGLVQESKSADGREQPADAIMGSPRYMAPEQVQGQEVDARADVYSLGVVLYAMLTGHPPFERRTELATMMAQVSDPPPPMSSTVPDLVLPPWLEAVVTKCLAKNPDKRWASMTELITALQLRGGTGASLTAPAHTLRSPAPPTETPGLSEDASTTPARSSSPSRRSSGRMRGPRSKSAPPSTESMRGAPLRRRKGKGQPMALVGFIAVVAALTGLALFDRPPVAPAAASSVVVAAPPAPPKASATLHVETVPPGAKVTEDGKPVCTATPCDVVYVGDAADPAADHLLDFLLSGYKLERKVAKAPGPSLTVTLTKAQ